MENIEQNIGQNIEPKIDTGKKINKKNIIILVIIGLVVILIGLGVWYRQVQKNKAIPASATIPAVPGITQPTPPAVKENSVSAINQELNNIDFGDLDKEFQAIDADLNSL